MELVWAVRQEGVEHGGVGCLEPEDGLEADEGLQHRFDLETHSLLLGTLEEE